GSRHGTAAIEHALCRVEVPVLALSIADDPVAPPGARDELLAHLPRARVTRGELPGGASGSPWQRHFTWVREPDACAARVAAWLATQCFPYPDATITSPLRPLDSQGTHHVLA
ncbi:MAG TPA: hypothetical protein VFU71_21440, partial [Burkholderiaceae bacterium]|nr:hypothetical protein [Burkholderiaceae bacterium]